MLVLESGPKGSQAKPKRGAKLRQFRGWVIGVMPGSPGKTRPSGAFGYRTDCAPGRKAVVSRLPSVTPKLGSHRSPKFNVRFRRAFQSSCTKAASESYRLSVRTVDDSWEYRLGRPSRYSAQPLFAMLPPQL